MNENDFRNKLESAITGKIKRRSIHLLNRNSTFQNFIYRNFKERKLCPQENKNKIKSIFETVWYS